MNKDVEIVIAGRDKQSIDQLASILESPGRRIEVRHIVNGHADPLYGLTRLPNLLIFHAGSSGIEEIEALIERPPSQRVPSLVIGPADDVKLIRLAMKGGARDYLPEPFDSAELIKNVEALEQEIEHEGEPQEGELVAVISAKGGSGASCIATNLAHMLAADCGKRTVLVDLDTQFGCLSQYLDIESKHGLREGIELIDELDAVALDACTSKHSSGLALMDAGRDELMLPGQYPAEALARLLDLLKSNYDRVVIDLPRQIDDFSATTLQRADRIMVVLQQDLAALRDAARLRQIMCRNLGIEEGRIRLTVNRFDKKSNVELSDICKSLSVSREDIDTIPNQFREVSESINIGVPMLEYAKNGAFSKALLQVARSMAQQPEGKPTGLFAKAVTNLLRG